MREVVSIQYALLALLSEERKDSVRLRAELAVLAGAVRPLTGAVRPLDAGRVDTTLQRLERDGFAESGGDRADGPRDRFRITAAGERELARWLRTPPDLDSSPHDELAAKILVALRVPGTDVPEVVQAHRRYLIEVMQQWTRVKQDNPGPDLGLALRVDAALCRLDSIVRWLDAAGRHLERTAGRPPQGARATSKAMDDHLRTSDADRDRVTVRLRDHYAEGRLTSEELDERVTAALHARTFGDLRRVMADLPGPGPASQQARTPPTTAVPRPGGGWRGPQILPLVLLGAMAMTGGGRPFKICASPPTQSHVFGVEATVEGRTRPAGRARGRGAVRHSGRTAPR
jgi:DNA-binding PadR family transcriptional regulator